MSEAIRHTTADEIARLGAAQGRSRKRGLVALLGGAATALCVTVTIYLVTRDTRPPPAAVPARLEPQVLRPEPDAPAPPAPNRLPAPSRRSPRPKDPVAALAAPTELPRPAGPSAPVVRAKAVDLEDLARSLAAQKKGAVQLCFEKELKRDPRLRGTVTVALELKAPHDLGAIDVQTSLPRKSFIKCVGQAMQTLDYPPLPDDVRVELPFVLKTPDL